MKNSILVAGMAAMVLAGPLAHATAGPTLTMDDSNPTTITISWSGWDSFELLANPPGTISGGIFLAGGSSGTYTVTDADYSLPGPTGNPLLNTTGSWSNGSPFAGANEDIYFRDLLSAPADTQSFHNGQITDLGPSAHIGSFNGWVRPYTGYNYGNSGGTATLMTAGVQSYTAGALTVNFIPEGVSDPGPVPEASTVAGAGVVAGLAAWTALRRRRVAA